MAKRKQAPKMVEVGKPKRDTFEEPEKGSSKKRRTGCIFWLVVILLISIAQMMNRIDSENEAETAAALPTIQVVSATPTLTNTATPTATPTNTIEPTARMTETPRPTRQGLFSRFTRDRGTETPSITPSAVSVSLANSTNTPLPVFTSTATITHTPEPTHTFTPLPLPTHTLHPPASYTPITIPTITNTPIPLPTQVVMMTYFVIGTSGANARTCSQTTCDIATSFSPGTRLDVMGSENGQSVSGSNVWAVVSHNGRTVYVHSSLLSDREPTPFPTSVPNQVVAPPVEQPAQPPAQSGCDCNSGDTLNCGNFTRQRDAQACYNKCMQEVGRDVHRLDGRDNDGRACESLP